MGSYDIYIYIYTHTHILYILLKLGIYNLMMATGKGRNM